VFEIFGDVMIEKVTVRQAEEKDIPFVIEAIFESEKSGADVITSCRIFQFTEEKFKEILTDVLAQNIEHYDYYLSGFAVAELNGESIGALGSWLEGKDDTASGIIKASAFFPYFDKSMIKSINANTRVVKGLSFNREKGTLQLEHGYVVEKYRRKGVFTKLLAESITRNYKKYNGFPKVQGILLKDNYKSFNVHSKFGYVVAEEKTIDDPEIYKFFAYNTKVLMEYSDEKVKKLCL
jgi:GNAT superfamily N-acetyltransferase